ncbi:RNA polymerase sigma factor CarQ [Planctomycetes bacterium CA13]|uniref:RNA polymerase sigma factor CarQ n=1 Tax=Novipirellula herctigrandis TaxID=2527986 RepID=A0A5C5Z2D8_9BACT|nr:RNA polymerase sigma factor CarQ [Planctomycetes bacterium CA13]
MTDEQEPAVDIAKEEAFMRLFLQSERRILGFVLSLVPNMADAEDLLQETCTTMWRKYDAFEPGTNFAAWGITIARYQVLRYRRKKQTSKVLFSEPTMLMIAEAAGQLSSQSDVRAEALQSCLSELREKDHQLIQLKYFAENSTKEVSAQVGRSVESVYKSLNRIHDRLLYCIRQSLRAERAN